MNVTNAVFYVAEQDQAGLWHVGRQEQGPQGLFDLVNTATPRTPWLSVKVGIVDGPVLWQSEVDQEALGLEDDELYGTADGARREGFLIAEAEQMYSAQMKAGRLAAFLGCSPDDPRGYASLKAAEVIRQPMEDDGLIAGARYLVKFVTENGVRVSADMRRYVAIGNEQVEIAAAKANGRALSDQQIQALAPMLWNVALVGSGSTELSEVRVEIPEYRLRAPTSSIQALAHLSKGPVSALGGM